MKYYNLYISRHPPPHIKSWCQLSVETDSHLCLFYDNFLTILPQFLRTLKTLRCSGLSNRWQEVWNICEKLQLHYILLDSMVNPLLFIWGKGEIGSTGVSLNYIWVYLRFKLNNLLLFRSGFLWLFQGLLLGNWKICFIWEWISYILWYLFEHMGQIYNF